MQFFVCFKCLITPIYKGCKYNQAITKLFSRKGLRKNIVSDFAIFPSEMVQNRQAEKKIFWIVSRPCNGPWPQSFNHGIEAPRSNCLSTNAMKGRGEDGKSNDSCYLGLALSVRIRSKALTV